jgi:hypothetical protein
MSTLKDTIQVFLRVLFLCWFKFYSGKEMIK